MKAREIAYVAVGSNLGDPAKIVRRAFRELKVLTHKPLRASSLWRTAPVDCPPGSPPFINAVVALEPKAGETPPGLLRKLRRLEKSLGRTPKKMRNEPRLLDLDLIAFGARTMNSATLTLPHPRAHLRRFVLRPLCEIAPGLILPGQKKTVPQLLRALKSDEQMRRVKKIPA